MKFTEKNLVWARQSKNSSNPKARKKWRRKPDIFHCCCFLYCRKFKSTVPRDSPKRSSGNTWNPKEKFRTFVIPGSLFLLPVTNVWNWIQTQQQRNTLPKFQPLKLLKLKIEKGSRVTSLEKVLTKNRNPLPWRLKESHRKNIFLVSVNVN